MPVRINSNVAFSRAISDFNRVDRDTQIHRARLASGLRLNSGRDGGAALSMSDGMRAEISGLAQGARNTETAIDLLRVAEGGMSEISNVLIRLREIATEVTTSTLNGSNRIALDDEFNQLNDFIDRSAKLVSYNDQSLLAGFGNKVSESSSALAESSNTGVRRVTLSAASAGTYTFADDAGDGSLTLSNGEVSQTLSLDTLLDEGKVADGTTLVANFDRLGIRVFLDGIGAGGVAGSYRDGDLDGRSIVIEDASGGVFQLGGDAVGADRLEYDLSDMTSQGTVVDIADISILTQSSARDALARIDGAVARVARERGAVGAIVNRLEHTLNVTTTSIEGIAASEAALRDADIALEVSALARNEILAGLSRSVMTQARVSTNIVMSLLTQ